MIILLMSCLHPAHILPISCLYSLIHSPGSWVSPQWLPVQMPHCWFRCLCLKIWMPSCSLLQNAGLVSQSGAGRSSALRARYGQPLCGLSRVKAPVRNLLPKSDPYLLPRSEVCGHRAFRRAHSRNELFQPYSTKKSVLFQYVLLYPAHILPILLGSCLYPAYIRLKSCLFCFYPA